MDWQLLLHGLPDRMAKVFEALRGKVMGMCW